VTENGPDEGVFINIAGVVFTVLLVVFHSTRVSSGKQAALWARPLPLSLVNEPLKREANAELMSLIVPAVRRRLYHFTMNTTPSTAHMISLEHLTVIYRVK